AVSPPGGDFSEPVTQNTKRFVRAFWQLDKGLASARHYPSINWIQSYSEYAEYVSDWWIKNVDAQATEIRRSAYSILLQEEKLQKIVKLIGPDALPDKERLVLETAIMIKDGFLKQNAYDTIDMYTVPKKQLAILKIIIEFFEEAEIIITMGAPIFEIRALDCFSMIIRARLDIANEELDKFEKLSLFIKDELNSLRSKYSKVNIGAR
ncbi:MAG: V-type ATP synthase subunit A, partial [Brevinema sp.]